MKQLNNQFVPTVLPISINDEVTFPNYDETQHNVYSFAKAKSFEIQLHSSLEKPQPILFPKSGVVPVGCNIHDWMLGYVIVLPTNIYAVTNEVGTATLDRVEEAEQTLYLWSYHYPDNDGFFNYPIKSTAEDVIVKIDEEQLKKLQYMTHVDEG